MTGQGLKLFEEIPGAMNHNQGNWLEPSLNFKDSWRNCSVLWLQSTRGTLNSLALAYENPEEAICTMTGMNNGHRSPDFISPRPLNDKKKQLKVFSWNFPGFYQELSLFLGENLFLNLAEILHKYYYTRIFKNTNF